MAEGGEPAAVGQLQLGPYLALFVFTVLGVAAALLWFSKRGDKFAPKVVSGDGASRAGASIRPKPKAKKPKAKADAGRGDGGTMGFAEASQGSTPPPSTREVVVAAPAAPKVHEDLMFSFAGGPFQGLSFVNLHTPPHNFSETIEGALSISFAAQWDGLRTWGRIVDFGNGASSDNIIIANFERGKTLVVDLYRGTSRKRLLMPSVIQVGEMHRYLFTVTAAGGMKMFRDNALLNQLSNGYAPRGVERTHLYVGGASYNNECMFQGRIVDLKVWRGVVDWNTAFPDPNPSEGEQAAQEARAADPVSPPEDPERPSFSMVDAEVSERVQKLMAKKAERKARKAKERQDYDEGDETGRIEDDTPTEQAAPTSSTFAEQDASEAPATDEVPEEVPEQPFDEAPVEAPAQQTAAVEEAESAEEVAREQSSSAKVSPIEETTPAASSEADVIQESAPAAASANEGTTAENSERVAKLLAKKAERKARRAKEKMEQESQEVPEPTEVASVSQDAKDIGNLPAPTSRAWADVEEAADDEPLSTAEQEAPAVTKQLEETKPKPAAPDERSAAEDAKTHPKPTAPEERSAAEKAPAVKKQLEETQPKPATPDERSAAEEAAPASPPNKPRTKAKTKNKGWAKVLAPLSADISSAEAKVEIKEETKEETKEEAVAAPGAEEDDGFEIAAPTRRLQQEKKAKGRAEEAKTPASAPSEVDTETVSQPAPCETSQTEETEQSSPLEAQNKQEPKETEQSSPLETQNKQEPKVVAASADGTEFQGGGFAGPPRTPLEREIMRLEKKAREIDKLRQRLADGEVLEPNQHEKVAKGEELQQRIAELHKQRVAEQEATKEEVGEDTPEEMSQMPATPHWQDSVPVIFGVIPANGTAPNGEGILLDGSGMPVQMPTMGDASMPMTRTPLRAPPPGWEPWQPSSGVMFNDPAAGAGGCTLAPVSFQPGAPTPGAFVPMGKGKGKGRGKGKGKGKDKGKDKGIKGPIMMEQPLMDLQMDMVSGPPAGMFVGGPPDKGEQGGCCEQGGCGEPTLADPQAMLCGTNATFDPTDPSSQMMPPMGAMGMPISELPMEPVGDERWEVCWEWVRSGWCPRGITCRWEHPMAAPVGYVDSFPFWSPGSEVFTPMPDMAFGDHGDLGVLPLGVNGPQTLEVAAE